MGRLSRNKKGTEVIGWVFNILIFGAILGIIVIITNSAFSKKLDTHNLEYSIISARIVNNPFCLAYEDKDTKRIYPGIIDISKFEENKLQECIITTDELRPLGVRLELKTVNSNYEPIFLNEENYLDYSVLSFSELFVLENRSMYVLIKQGDELVPGILNFAVAGETQK